jgi:hypothetical protein
MNIRIFTRSDNAILYQQSSNFLSPDIERIPCRGFNNYIGSREYLHYLISLEDDWIVNIDDDVFIPEWNVIQELIDHMKTNGYEYCGMPDGGVCPHRNHSWMACNTYFNVFHISSIKNKLVEKTILDNFSYPENLEYLKPDFVSSSFVHDYFEPYYNLFYWLMTSCKGLFLDAASHTDGITSILLWNNKTIAYKTWYKDSYQRNSQHRSRIDSVINEVFSLRQTKGAHIAHQRLPVTDKRAILLVTYRDRALHLERFISVISEYFSKDQIYVIEQADLSPFNRGMLFNVGFKETEHLGDYFIMHDVDLIPLPGKVDYSYCSQPTHLSAHCSQFNYQLPYQNIFGGVITLTPADFNTVNGFPNKYKGWGGEDDALYESFIKKGIIPQRKNCWFESLAHERHIDNVNYRHNLQLLRNGRDFSDGITSCDYTVISRSEKEHYIHLLVDINVSH